MLYYHQHLTDSNFMLLFLIPTKNTNIQKYLLHIEEQTTKNDLEEFFFFLISQIIELQSGW